MALCQYCGKVDIAWQQQADKKYVAFHAKRDEAGNVVRQQVANGGGRVVARPIADITKPHYPHTHHGAAAYGLTASECPVWTPALAQARPRYRKGAARPRPQYTPAPVVPAPGMAAPADLEGMLAAGEPIAAYTPKGVPVDVDVDAIRGMVRGEMVKVLDEYGVTPPAQEIVVRRADGAVVKMDGAMHVKVPTIIEYLSRGRHVYLYGGAGGGKTHAACQALTAVCDDVNVLTMPGLTTGKLFGFTDAAGVYRDTAFVRAYRDGGGIVLDELDRAMPAVAAALNSVLENRRATFDGVEVPMHAKFGLVATGNTDMRGGTRTYTGAQPLDLATAARFAFVYWDYDQELEGKLVADVVGVKPAGKLLAWGRGLRATLAADRHDTVFAGPREMIRIAEDVAAGVPLADAVNAWVWRGLDAAVVGRVMMRHPLPVLDVKVGA